VGGVGQDVGGLEELRGWDWRSDDRLDWLYLTRLYGRTTWCLVLAW
jgi:hypothetical protein